MLPPVKVLSTNSIKAALEGIVPLYERGLKHKLAMDFAPAAALKGRIENGEPFDVAILTSSAMDELIRTGWLSGATRASVARSSAGVAIRQGGPRPDLATREGFKRSLLAAKSIAYVDIGATAAGLRRVFEQLGVARQMQAKTRLLSGESAAEAVARGDAELGFTQISEILPVSGAELAGPLPPGVEIHTPILAAVSARSERPGAAQSFIEFLSTPAAAALIRAKGMDTCANP
jgi:molybdate transport system substrate-binding protein